MMATWEDEDEESTTGRLQIQATQEDEDLSQETLVVEHLGQDTQYSQVVVMPSITSS